MPHSRSTSESPIKTHKKKRHHERASDKHRHKKHRHDQHSSKVQHTQDSRHSHSQHFYQETEQLERRIKEEPDSHLHRRIKQEHDEFINRDDRAYYDEQRRDNHRRRVAEGRDNFTRVDSNSEHSGSQSVKKEKEKEKPNFELSGKLADETNTFRGVVVKYNEPPEARKPKRRWRLFPFKGDESLPTLPIHRQSAYLLGRDRIVADIPTDHPSCSKQHAALQFRLVSYDRDDGTEGRCVRPYVIDLDSANGTYVNNNRIESRCYVEIREKDVIKFGYSSREYVLLHDKSDTAELYGDDDGED